MQNLLFAAVFGLAALPKMTGQDTLLTAADCLISPVITVDTAYLIPFTAGAGLDETELNSAPCFSNGVPGNFEINSSWMRWQCPADGQILFQITPIHPTDDLDFTVWKLAGGLNADCGNKELVRCMAAGDITFPSPCMGPTGLKLGETDVAEAAGCSPMSNNFLAPLDVLAGDWFALEVNNFTSTGNGYLLHFSGTGTVVSSREPGDWPTSASLFPNPTDGPFQIDFILKKAGEMQFSIQNTAGVVVFEKTENRATGPQSAVFDLENEAAGSYFLRMTDGEASRFLKVVKR